MANLLTLAEYKVLKGKSSSNLNEDARIEANITSVSNAVKEYIGRSLIDYFSTTKTEYYKGNEPFILLKEYPIVAAVVSYKTSTGYTNLVEGTDYYIESDSGIIESIDDTGFDSTSRDPKFIKVEYTAGFETAPKDIKMAVADLVEKQIKQEHSISKSMGGQDTMNYPAAPVGRFPTHIAIILDMYRVPMG